MKNISGDESDVRPTNLRYEPLRHKGEDNPPAKLSEDDVRDIRRRYQKGLGAQLAREKKVTPQTIHDIIHRHTWKHI